MSLDAWPTLEEMILRQKRVVILMDYNTNQVCHPAKLDFLFLLAHAAAFAAYLNLLLTVPMLFVTETYSRHLFLALSLLEEAF